MIQNDFEGLLKVFEFPESLTEPFLKSSVKSKIEHGEYGSIDYCD